MKKILLLTLLVSFNLLIAQQNCELLKDDPKCYKACQLYNQESEHYQGSYASQKHLSDAIELCPTLSNAYFEKSVAYLKRGLFIQWKQLIDKAVELAPRQHLSYRAWCQFSFLHNYEETIRDLNKLTELEEASFIGVGQSGDYDLRIVLALSYKQTKKNKKAIEIMESTMAKKDYYLGPYDYLHLGVMYLENEQFDKAVKAFKKQIQENELAEVYFYLATTFLKIKNEIEAKVNSEKALELYKNGRKMHSFYYEFHDQIYLKDIQKLMGIVIQK